MSTEGLLQDWKAKTDAATEGPWCTKEHRNETGDWESTDLIHDYVTPSGQTWRDQVLGYVDLDEADADFIVTARTAMPRLLAAVEAIRALIAEHERIEFHNANVSISRISDLEREPTSEDYRRALDAALSGSEPDNRESSNSGSER